MSLKRKPTMREKLSRCLCDKRELDRKALKIQKCLKEVEELLNKSCQPCK